MLPGTVQENWGTANPGGTASLVIPLTGGNNPGGVGTTGGNAVLVLVGAPASITGVPTGWSADKAVGTGLYALSVSDIPAGETSWTFTLSGPNSTDFSFYVVELSGVDPVAPLEVSAATATMANTIADGGTLSTQTTPRSAALDMVVFAAFVADRTVSPTWSNYTNDFEEVQEVTTGTPAFRLAVARKLATGATSTFETTATLDTSGASSPSAGALIVAYRAAGSPIAAPLAGLFGFEPGTLGGINVSLNSPANLMSTPVGALTASGTFGTSYLAQAGSARNSGYGLRVVQAASIAYVQAGSFGGQAFSFGFDTRVVSATGTVVVASFAGGTCQLLYDTTTNKFGMRAGTTGTVSWQSGTTALGTFVWVEFRVKVNTTTWRVEWRIETAADTYTEQAAATLAGQVTGPLANQTLMFGHSAAQTMTADFDNVVGTTFWAAYPLTPHQVRLLVPDTAATVTYSGTPGNFAIVASNATSTALAGTGGNITTSGVAARLDDVPPDVSAATDGVVQTTSAASDYLQFPMQDPTVAEDEIVAGVRMLAALISTTGAGAGDLAIRGWDGSAETALATVSQITPGAPTAISATAPMWRTAMWQQANGWTKAKLLAAALRMGFSPDATPDMGCRNLLIEYAVCKVRTNLMFGEADAVLRVESLENPNTQGIRTLRAYTPADQAATLRYEIDGVEQSPVSVPAGSNPLSVELDAETMPTISRVILEPAF